MLVQIPQSADTSQPLHQLHDPYFHMSNTYDITTFQFLEEIQSKFIKRTAADDGNNPYATRRLIDFLNDSAKLHIIEASDENLNGHAEPIATVTLENVAQKGEPSTFAIGISVKPFENLQKSLSITSTEDAMDRETSKVISTLTEAIEKAPKDEPATEPSVAEESPASSNEGEDATAGRRRRSRLRSE